MNEANNPVVVPIENRPGDYLFWCPGCKCGHGFRTQSPGPVWSWDGNVIKPTVSPSIRTIGQIQCHLFVKNGELQFCSDCEHPLAGKTVAMEPIDPTDRSQIEG